MEVLVENKHKGRWRGRTPQGKLLFFDDARDLRGKVVNVRVTYAGPWSLSGIIEPESALGTTTKSIPLTIVSQPQ